MCEGIYNLHKSCISPICTYLCVRSFFACLYIYCTGFLSWSHPNSSSHMAIQSYKNSSAQACTWHDLHTWMYTHILYIYACTECINICQYIYIYMRIAELCYSTSSSICALCPSQHPIGALRRGEDQSGDPAMRLKKKGKIRIQLSHGTHSGRVFAYREMALI